MIYMPIFRSSKDLAKNIVPEQGDLFWPEYSIRKSHRAKYLRINVCPGKGVELVVPKRTSIKAARRFLERHQEWINQQLEKYGPPCIPQLPDEINLQAIRKKWQVKYHFGHHRQYRTRDDFPTLTLSGPTDDYMMCKTRLRQWLRHAARQTFHEWLRQASESTGIPYQKLTIRSQKTRWGSCSSKGNISLNDRLMFLPPETVEYVMVHELCHTMHMNHSKRFWETVKNYCPDYKNHERQLRGAKRELPDWIF